MNTDQQKELLAALEAMLAVGQCYQGSVYVSKSEALKEANARKRARDVIAAIHDDQRN